MANSRDYESVVDICVSTLMSKLRNYTEDQLQNLLQDESRLNAMVDSMPQVSSLPNDKEIKLAQSKSLAEYNLSIEPQLNKALSHLRETHANAVRTKEEVNEMKAKLDSVAEARSLDSVCVSLKNRAQNAEDESETAAELFYKGAMEIDDFIKKFTEKRVIGHTRRLKAEKLAELLRQQCQYQQQHQSPSALGMTTQIPYPSQGVAASIMNRILSKNLFNRFFVGYENLPSCRHYPTLRSSANAPKPDDLYEPRFESDRSYSVVPLFKGSRIHSYLKLIRADKPIGTWLLYWPCAWSIALAAPPGCLPSPYFLALFGGGAFLMRSAGCILNDLWDQDIDKRVDRTKSRPLACGEVTEKEAFFVLSGLLTVSLAILMQFNWLSIVLGSSSVFFVALYPLAKRYTNWPQLILGITFNWGALLGFTAVTGTFSSAVCVPLYLACVCWTIIYDTIYAQQDKKDDLLIGIGSTAVQFGDHSNLWLTFASLGMLSNLLFLGFVSEQLWPYFLALFASGSHLAWQLGTLHVDDPSDCWQKFLANQWLGTVIFGGILLSNLLKKGETNDENSEEELEMDEQEKFMMYFGQRNMNKLSTTLKMLSGDFEYEDPKSEEEVVNITYVTRDGTEKKIRGKVGDNAMYLAHRYNIEIEGACEASLACCTCHVYVDEKYYDKLPAPVEDEEDMLDMAPLLKPNSRLSSINETSLMDQQQKRYDRQIRLWGDDGQLSIQQARVCVFGSNALAAETLKSLVLAGIGSFHIIDKALVDHADFGQNFFVEEGSLGSNRAECLVKALKELNHSVHGQHHPISFGEFKRQDFQMLLQFSLVIGTSLTANEARQLDQFLFEHDIPFVYANVCGMMGHLRLSFREHYILDNHAENAAYDLRLDFPFPELLQLDNETNLESMTHEQHSHTPFLLLYLKAIDKWRKSQTNANDKALFPDITSFKTRKEFEQILMKMRQPDDKGSLDEQNFTEAKQNLLKGMRKSNVPENVKKVLLDRKASAVTGDALNREWVDLFWILAAALREFIDKNGNQMPISGQLPDMTSDSRRYAQLLGVYRNKSMEHAVQLFALAKDIQSARLSLLSAGSSSSSNYIPAAVATSNSLSSTDESMNSTDDEALTTDESEEVSRMSTSDPIELQQNATSMDCSAEDANANESSAFSLPQTEANEITLERCQSFVKSASRIAIQYGTSLSYEFNADLKSIFDQIEPADVRAVPPRVHPLCWYAILRATDRFRALNGRFPGSTASSQKGDAKELKKIVGKLFSETQNAELISSQDELVPPETIAEVCRYGGSEPHVVAAILGGCVAQEAIKLCTHQYMPVDNSLLFDAHSQQAASFRVVASQREEQRTRKTR
ncbi:hypothetical protein niasHS_002460 [Heterodera schachtii]|uniref:4-hydroxybenzoate polyprenyltransferase, mitochondrial n=1 Tax=Heterodera schachtii TaxID=97005 RepID=A0ABD2KK17_HETSC